MGALDLRNNARWGTRRLIFDAFQNENNLMISNYFENCLFLVRVLLLRIINEKYDQQKFYLIQF